MTPFEVIYGREPPKLLIYISGTARVAQVEHELLERDKVLKDVWGHISRAQGRIKQIYDSKHQEWEFTIGDWVFLKLQPYKQMSFASWKNHKLSPKFYGPFQILEGTWKVVYKLDLPS